MNSVEKIRHIQITSPWISELDISYVNDAVTNGWGPRCYEYIHRFEDTFAKYLDVGFAHATSSCTGAIHLALMALGLEPGDEVIIPETTWVATTSPVLYINASPVFVDVLEDTWCIDPSKIEAAITPKTKAIIVVHLYGGVVEMDEVMKIARKHNLKVLEDSAQAIGSEYKGRKVGTMGDAGVFSFHGTKTISTGEGGMLVTNDAEVMRKARILNDHGRDPEIPITFWMPSVGFKYKMSNLQAALGCAQIERVEEIVSSKREIFGWYQKYMTGIEDIRMNVEQPYVKNSYWMPTILWGDSWDFDRDMLVAFLKEQRIDTRPFFFPLSSLPFFEDQKENTVAYRIFDRALNLPSHPGLTESDIMRVCKSVKTFFAAL